MNRASVRLILVLLLVGTVLWVPAAVRASGNVRTPGSSIIRLNRGFDMPVERALVAPADAPTLPVASGHTLRTPVSRDAIVLHVVLPDSPDTDAPDLLRGPPAVVVL